jgi:hypothetical protein
MRGVGEPFEPDVESKVTQAIPTGSDVYVELASWKYVPILVSFSLTWHRSLCLTSPNKRSNIGPGRSVVSTLPEAMTTPRAKV